MSEKPLPNPYLVPLSILAAGAMVAFAVYASRINAGPAAPALGEGQPAAETTAENMRPVDETDHIWGSRDADLIVVEYSDIQCPFCDRFHPTMERIVEEYQGRVAWVYRHLPLEALHSEAFSAAVATECAAELGGNETFWNYLNALFEYQTTLGPTTYLKVAREQGLSEQAFEACMKDTKHGDRVRADMDDAAAAGGQGTPYNIIVTKSGKKLPFSGALPYQQVKTLVDRALELDDA